MQFMKRVVLGIANLDLCDITVQKKIDLIYYIIFVLHNGLCCKASVNPIPNLDIVTSMPFIIVQFMKTM